ncbi:MAG TPA: hypothetical protein ENK58_02915 [Desulfobacterales bacterium]|nr:hypothetical protein [Desulfobacterales bacterium]
MSADRIGYIRKFIIPPCPAHPKDCFCHFVRDLSVTFDLHYFGNAQGIPCFNNHIFNNHIIYSGCGRLSDTQAHAHIKILNIFNNQVG